MKTTHDDLIQLARLLGYEDFERGLCAGFQGMWMQAVFAQDKRGFENRLHLIAQYKEKFPLLIEEIKQALHKKETLTEAEQHIIDILVFLDGVALYLTPDNKKDYFGQFTFQSNINSIFSVVKPLSIEKNNCEKIFEKAYIFTKDSLSSFLNETALLLQSQSVSPNPVIHLANIGHRVSLSFDTENKHWEYVDTNDFSHFPKHKSYQRNLTTDVLVNSIFTSFSASKEATFFTSMWTINDSEQLKNSMNTLALNYPITNLINNSNINLLSWIACKEGQLELIKELLKPEYKIDIKMTHKDGTTPFFMACLNGHIGIVKELLKLEDKIHIYKAGQGGETPFFIACQNGHTDIVKELLKPEYKIDINEANLDGTTPLYIACQNGHTDIVKELLKPEYKIHINKTQHDGVTPFYIACQNGHTDIVKELLKPEYPIDINEANLDGTTPFYIACQYGHTAIIKLLLASPNLETREKVGLTGHTPLLVACLSPHTKDKKELFQELLKYDPNLSHKNEANQTALDIAFATDNQIAIQLILQAAVVQNYSPLQIMSSETFQKALALFVDSQNDHTEIANLLRSHNALQPNKNTFFVTPHLLQSAENALPRMATFKNTL